MLTISTHIKNFLKLIIPDTILEYRRKRLDKISKFISHGNARQEIYEKYGYEGSLLDVFADIKIHQIRKWQHYIPLYDLYFSNLLESKKQIRFLEIGVSDGGSLQMWRKWFGEDAVIFGIDIDPSCEKLNGISGQVRIGSQDNKEFLDSVIDEMGGVDIILDDGSHHMDHVSKTLRYLFPRLSDGGVYMIEDLHTAYWRQYGGGYKTQKNFYGFLMNIVDDMHHWWHGEKMHAPEISKICPSIHIHDSVVVLEKNKTYEPALSIIK